MDSYTLGLIIACAGGFLIGVASTIAYVYINGEDLIHHLRYKEYVLPCPACRDENDKPTGVIAPKSELLESELRKAGVKQATFDCVTCGGSKKITYEFPRHEKPDIDERQMLTSPAPGQPKPGGRWPRR